MEVYQNILPKQQQCLKSLYSSAAWTFPLGIKMQLILELGTAANSTTSAQVTQLTNCQGCFLTHIKTNRILQAVHNPCNLDLVYQTLWDMTLPSGLANLLGKPLFHAISPMVTKEGYLVQYLPQYCTQAQAVIAQLEDRLSQHPIASVTQSPPNITPTPQPLIVPMAASSSLVELDIWIGLRFCTPLLGPITREQPLGAWSLHRQHNTTYQPINHNIL